MGARNSLRVSAGSYGASLEVYVSGVWGWAFPQAWQSTGARSPVAFALGGGSLGLNGGSGRWPWAAGQGRGRGVDCRFCSLRHSDQVEAVTFMFKK